MCYSCLSPNFSRERDVNALSERHETVMLTNRVSKFEDPNESLRKLLCRALEAHEALNRAIGHTQEILLRHLKARPHLEKDRLVDELADAQAPVTKGSTDLLATLSALGDLQRSRSF